MFQHLPSPTSSVERFVAGFLRSRSVVDSAKSIVDYATRIQVKCPRVALSIGEHVQSTIGADIMNIQKATALLDDDLVSLAVAIRTHSIDSGLRARSLDLFERTMDLGSHHAMKVLGAVER